MAVPRVFAQSRSLLSRGFATSRVATAASRSIRPAFSQRLFTSSATFSQEVAQTPAAGSEAPSKATSNATQEPAPGAVFLVWVPRLASRSEIQEFFRREGIKIKKLQLSFDRFTFRNDGRCFVELADDQQAQEAIQRLSKAKLFKQPVRVQAAWPSFRWVQDVHVTEEGGVSRYFYQSNEGKNEAAEAVKPIIEGRRCLLQVQPPGWASDKTANETARQVIKEHMGKFGIATISSMSAFYGETKKDPRLMCWIDFVTKEGADAAIKEINNTEIQGRLTKLLVSKMAAWRAYQLGKVDPEALKQLQEADLAPKEINENKFALYRKIPVQKQI